MKKDIAKIEQAINNATITEKAKQLNNLASSTNSRANELLDTWTTSDTVLS